MLSPPNLESLERILRLFLIFSMWMKFNKTWAILYFVCSSLSEGDMAIVLALFFQDDWDCSVLEKWRSKKTTRIHFSLTPPQPIFPKHPLQFLVLPCNNMEEMERKQTQEEGHMVRGKPGWLGNRMGGDFYHLFIKTLPYAVLLLFLTSLSCSCPKVSFFHL